MYYKEHQYYIKDKQLLCTDIFGNLNILENDFNFPNNSILFPFSNNKIEIKDNKIIQNELIKTANIKGIELDNINKEKIINFLKKQFKKLQNLSWYLFNIDKIIYLVVTNNDNIYILDKSKKNNLTSKIKEIYKYNNNTINSWEVIECEPKMNQENILSFENNKFIGCQNGIIKI